MASHWECSLLSLTELKNLRKSIKAHHNPVEKETPCSVLHQSRVLIYINLMTTLRCAHIVNETFVGAGYTRRSGVPNEDNRG